MCAGEQFLSPVKWKEYTDFGYFDIGREEMEDLLDNIGQPFGPDKVSIKLNN